MQREATTPAPEETRLSVVIPAFNEERRLPPTLELIGAHLERHRHWLPAEILLVDDGSTDGTPRVARSVALPAGVRLELLRHPHNLGKGAAVRTGFSRAVGAAVLLTDADLAAPIGELETLAAAAGGRTVVIGSRAVDRSLIETRQPLYRDIMGRTFNLAVRVLALPGVADTQCGFKLFPGPLARDLAVVQRIAGFAYDVELLLLARHWGYRVREVAVRWRHVEASRVQAMRHSRQMLVELLALAARRITGRLPARPPSRRTPTAP
jgi:dolichyl-phosphate beta-glucosyltransferase